MMEQLRRMLDELVEQVASVEPGAQGGLVLHRLPDWARAQVGDRMLDWAESQPAGAVLRYATDAPEVRLTLLSWSLPTGVTAPPALILRSGATTTRVPLARSTPMEFDPAIGVFRFPPAGPETVVLRSPSREAPVSVLLPHNATIEVLGLDADAPIRSAPPDDRPLWVHYGSSISHCTDAGTPDRTWPQQVADGQGWRLRNLGLAGSAQLDAAVARVIGDLPADLITLKVGINVTNADSMRVRAYRPALEGFLDTIRERRPETPIVLISAIACPAQESSPGPIVFTPNGFAAARRDVQDDSGALTLRETRAIAAAVVERRRSSDPRIAYLDGRELLAEAEAALLPDGLHPGQQGMDLIAERFQRLVPPLLHRMR